MDPLFPLRPLTSHVEQPVDDDDDDDNNDDGNDDSDDDGKKQCKSDVVVTNKHVSCKTNGSHSSQSHELGYRLDDN